MNKLTLAALLAVAINLPAYAAERPITLGSARACDVDMLNAALPLNADEIKQSQIVGIAMNQYGFAMKLVDIGQKQAMEKADKCEAFLNAAKAAGADITFGMGSIGTHGYYSANIELALKLGANPNKYIDPRNKWDTYGRQALSTMPWDNERDERAIKALISSMGDLNQLVNGKTVVLDQLTRKAFWGKRDDKVLLALLDAGANPTITGKIGGKMVKPVEMYKGNNPDVVRRLMGK